VKNNFGDLDKSDTDAGDPLISEKKFGQNESISVYPSKVGSQNQVFHKFKLSVDGEIMEKMEKQNSIERLNSSLSSDVAPCEYLGEFSKIYTIPRGTQQTGPGNGLGPKSPLVKRVKFDDTSLKSGGKVDGKISSKDVSERNNSKVNLCAAHKQKRENK